MIKSIKIKISRVLSFLIFFYSMISVNWASGASLLYLGMWDTTTHTPELG
jgi:hypothetical protein